MIKRRTATLFILSLGFAVGAAWIANNWIQSQQQVTEAKVEKPQSIPVVSAAVDIPYGETITANHLQVSMVPAEVAPVNGFTSAAQVQGQIANAHILQGEVIRTERVSSTAPGTTLAMLIDPEMRAITVRVDDVVGVAGFLLPGNKVDIIATRKPRKGERVISNTVIRDVKVLAVDQLARTDKNDPVVVRAVTLEVTPPMAERLAQARDEGKIQLTLRNPVAIEPPPPVISVAPKRKQRTVRRAPSGPPQIIVIKGTEWQKKKVPM